MKVLYFGHTGWIGGKLKEELIPYEPTICNASVRLDDHWKLLEYLHSISNNGFTHCVLAAGLTGTPNIDWCEIHKKEVIDVNVVGTYLLADWCKKYNIHLTYLGTGCIYQYDDVHTIENQLGFTEKDRPNSGNSYYSKTKIIIQEMLENLDNVLTLRIRMPITSEKHKKNLITKLSSFDKVMNIPNSVTVLDELLPIIPKMMERRLTGTYNFTNPGTISHNEILDMYIEYVDPSFTYSNFTEEEQNTMMTKRPNNCLDVSKLMNEFPHISDVKSSVRLVMQRMASN